MISGRCHVLTTLRHVSELSKQCSVNHNRSIVLLNNVPFGRQIRRFGYSHKGRSHGLPTLTSHVTMASTLSTAGKQDCTKKQNQLALEKSPYLLQHATNPVEWYPWGDEALEKAKREEKVIFLSIGYSTCHWCHVMERESFVNPEIAEIMNRYYVNIKVDREERPDIDRIYMTFVQAIQRHGGWPLSVFLTPDLMPFAGGTYFPPVEKYGQPGFKDLLLNVATKWTESRDDILDSSHRICEVLKQSIETSGLSKEERSLDYKLACAEQLIYSYDKEFCGFSNSPKFPQPVNFNFLFHVYAREPTSELGQECLNMCLQTLTKIANGGIHDHVGQGFSRYSVDARWHVPHFEKMLYDQAQLLRSYAEAFVVTKDTFFSNIIDDIVTYVTRDLRHEEGGFYSAEDADSLPSYDSVIKREGAFYVWTYEEISALLNKVTSRSDKLQLSDIFCYHYDVKPEGNVRACQDRHGELSHQNVLIVSGSVAETAEHFNCSIEDTERYLKEARTILYEARLKRPRPHLDDKIITAWNGLMISGLSNAGLAINNKRYIEYGEDAAKFIERYLFDKENRLLLRSCYRGSCNIITQASVPVNGFHVDYTFMVKGLLDLYEATFNTHWLAFAEELQDIQDELFWDSIDGAYFVTAKDDHAAILRLKDDHDGAEPASNSVACSNLLRLASYLDRTEFNDKANQLLMFFQKFPDRIPAVLPELVSALLLYHDTTTQIYIAGKKDAADTNELLNVVRERLIPGRVVFLVDQDHPDDLFRRNKAMSNMKPVEGRATAYVCRHQTCSLPVTEPKQLAALLNTKQ